MPLGKTLIASALLALAACAGQVSGATEEKEPRAKEAEEKNFVAREDPGEEDAREEEPEEEPSKREEPSDVFAPKSAATPGPAKLTPRLPSIKKDRSMMDHAYAFGWSKDSKEFAYCAESATTVRCEFVKTSGKREEVEIDTESGDTSKDKEIKARLRKKGYRTMLGDWPYASDLVLTWRAIDEESRKKPTRATLQVGALVEGEKETDYAVSIKMKDERFTEIHPEAISLSPNGAYLGVLSHAYGGEHSDTFQIEIVPIGEVASRAYNKTGLEHHRKGDYESSAELFRKSAAADPEYKWSYYNLACALTLLEEPGAEQALEKAIELDDALKERAQKDKDFDSVREEPWFAELTE